MDSMFHYKKLTKYSEPFNHYIIDDFLDETTAKSLSDNFPTIDDNWYKYDNHFEKKRAIDNLAYMPPLHSFVLMAFNSREFVEALEMITGISGLIPDPWLRGGGLHQIIPGGKLDVHADFNLHPHLKLQRRLNVLLYLNQGWQKEWGGELELWEKDMSKCAKKILPMYNKLVIFETNDDSFHGHPDPLKCPEGVTRKSMALYYYTAPEEAIAPHSTMFQKRPGDITTPEVEELRQKRGIRRL